MQNMRSHKNVCTLVTFSCLPRKMRVPVNFKLKSRISLKRVIVTVNKMGGVMICNYLSVNNPEVLWPKKAFYFCNTRFIYDLKLVAIILCKNKNSLIYKNDLLRIGVEKSDNHWTLPILHLFKKEHAWAHLNMRILRGFRNSNKINTSFPAGKYCDQGSYHRKDWYIVRSSSSSSSSTRHNEPIIHHPAPPRVTWQWCILL